MHQSEEDAGKCHGKIDRKYLKSYYTDLMDGQAIGSLSSLQNRGFEASVRHALIRSLLGFANKIAIAGIRWLAHRRLRGIRSSVIKY